MASMGYHIHPGGVRNVLQNGIRGRRVSVCTCMSYTSQPLTANTCGGNKDNINCRAMKLAMGKKVIMRKQQK